MGRFAAQFLGECKNMIRDVRSLCASVLLASLAGVAQAASPVFDNWVVNNGQFDGDGVAAGIQAPCATGFDCSILSSGDGFIQVQWVDTAPGGATYIQTIVTNPDANGTSSADLLYIDESFVQLGSSNGIMSRQRVREEDTTPVTGGVFTSSSELNIGWAATGPNDPTMVIQQTFFSAGDAAIGDEFRNDFVMELIGSTVGSDGNNQNARITVDQRVGLGDGVTDSTDVQRFYLVGTRGDLTQAGSLDLGPSFGGTVTGVDPAAVAWDSGDNVMVRWLGQRLDLAEQGQSVFGFQGIVNNTDNVEATTFSTIATGIEPDGDDGYQPPFDWHAAFGTTAPTPALPVSP